MGNIYSTISEEAKQFKELTSSENNSSSPQQGTPVSTPSSSSSSNNEEQQQNLNKLKQPFFDPRSPSQGVNRTPLEIEERNRRIEKARITNLFNKENNLLTVEGGASGGGGGGGGEPIVTTPTGPPNKDGSTTGLLFDPRSPNPEINRTPIGFSSSSSGGGGRNNNKKIQMFQQQN